MQIRIENILSGSIVVNEPSLDIKPSHLPVIVTLIRFRPTSTEKVDWLDGQQQRLMQLLPKIDMQVSIQEPSIRVLLPPLTGENSNAAPMLVSSFRGATLTVNSSHSLEDAIFVNRNRSF